MRKLFTAWCGVSLLALTATAYGQGAGGAAQPGGAAPAGGAAGAAGAAGNAQGQAGNPSSQPGAANQGQAGNPSSQRVGAGQTNPAQQGTPGNQATPSNAPTNPGQNQGSTNQGGSTAIQNPNQGANPAALPPGSPGSLEGGSNPYAIPPGGPGSIERRGAPQTGTNNPDQSGAATQRSLDNRGQSQSTQGQGNVQRSDMGIQNQTGVRSQTDNLGARSRTNATIDANGIARDRVLFDTNSFRNLDSARLGININSIDRSRLMVDNGMWWYPLPAGGWIYYNNGQWSPYDAGSVSFSAPKVTVQTGPDRWRYSYYNNEWWYWTPESRWVYYRDNSWMPYDATTFIPFGRWSAGYRGNAQTRQERLENREQRLQDRDTRQSVDPGTDRALDRREDRTERRMDRTQSDANSNTGVRNPPGLPQIDVNVNR